MKTISGVLMMEEGPKVGTISFDDKIREITFSGDSGADIYCPVDSSAIFPGFIDLSVNCHSESFDSAGNAALNGGVVQVCDLPKHSNPPVDMETYQRKQKIANRSLADVLLYGSIDADSLPFADIPYYTSVEVGDALERYRGLNVSFSAVEPIDTILDLMDKYKLTGKICNVATPGDVEKISKAGVAVEVNPHHLMMDSTFINQENKKFLSFLPPLQSSSDREEMIKHLAAGRITFIASDHSPYSIEEKMAGAMGAPHLDTFGQFLAYLIKTKSVSLDIITRVACINPGRWVGSFLTRDIGKLEIGYEASFSVLDFSKSASDGRPLQSKAGWSPFDLRKLPGDIGAVYLRGVKMVDKQWIKRVNFQIEQK